MTNLDDATAEMYAQTIEQQDERIQVLRGALLALNSASWLDSDPSDTKELADAKRLAKSAIGRRPT